MKPFTCWRAGAQQRDFDDLDEAIAWGREVDAFAVYDADDTIVYQEFPQAQWV